MTLWPFPVSASVCSIALNRTRLGGLCDVFVSGGTGPGEHATRLLLDAPLRVVLQDVVAPAEDCKVLGACLASEGRVNRVVDITAARTCPASRGATVDVARSKKPELPWRWPVPLEL